MSISIPSKMSRSSVSHIQSLITVILKKKREDARSQEQFLGLDKELKSLKKAVAASDKLAAAELSIAKDQLKSLHGTVMRINQERAEELQEAEKFSREAMQAAKDLTRAEAEIELLQHLLREREGQVSAGTLRHPLASSLIAQSTEVHSVGSTLAWPVQCHENERGKTGQK